VSADRIVSCLVMEPSWSLTSGVRMAPSISRLDIMSAATDSECPRLVWSN
jgi:hypothetical protein